METVEIGVVVFINPKRIDKPPYTTSEAIAQFAGVQHHTVTRLIRDNESDFQEFGLLGFEIHAVKQDGARGVKRKKVYCLNEEQATLLMTYLKNTPQVKLFKKELVRQFFAMRQKLNTLGQMREESPCLTDNIAIMHEDVKPHHFSNEYDLLNRVAIGMTAKQFRAEKGIPKGQSIRPYLTPEQAQMVAALQSVDIGYLSAYPDFQTRKKALIAYKTALTAYRDRRAALTAHE